MGSLFKKTAFALALGFLVFFLRPSLFGQNRRQGEDPLTLKIAVIGPGDEIYFSWGHIGLVVEDNLTGQSMFYDWGVFSFENENFFYNFAFGRLLYTCMVTWAEFNFDYYIQNNRDITLYTLNLPAGKKEEVLRFAENNVLPENCDYYYHNFRDNCATRIRDVIDMAVDGQFSAEFAGAPGRYTIRQHVRRHTWANPFFDWLLSFLMGQDIDRPVTVWDEMFLPSEIASDILDFRYTDSGGVERKLVSSVEEVYRSSGRPAVLEVPHRQWPAELLASLAFSGLLVFSYLRWGKKKGYTVFIGITQSLLGLFFGGAGALLFFMTFFTNHDYTFHNSNILFVNPLLFSGVPLGLLFAFSGSAKKRYASALFLRTLWIYVLLCGLLAMAVKLSPAFYQQNQVDLALVLPFTLSLVFIMTKLRHTAILK
jgi:hypothetical protein